MYKITLQLSEWEHDALVRLSDESKFDIRKVAKKLMFNRRELFRHLYDHEVKRNDFNVDFWQDIHYTTEINKKLYTIEKENATLKKELSEMQIQNDRLSKVIERMQLKQVKIS